MASTNEIHYYSAYGHDIAYQIYNPTQQNVPLVFIHGLSVSVRFWEAGMLDYVWQNHPWLSVSLPLHYPSRFPKDFDQHELNEQLFFDLLSGVIDTVYPQQKVIVIGHSLGAFSALNYATKAPERVLGVISISGFAKGKIKGLEATLQWLTTGFRLRKMLFRTLWRIMQSHIWFLKLAIRNYAYDTKSLFNYPALEPVLETVFPDVQRHDLRAMRYLFHSLLYLDIMEDLSKITCPVLIFAGKKDGIIPYHHMVSYQEKIPKGKLFSMEGVGHLPFAESPSEFEEKFVAWLRVR